MNKQQVSHMQKNDSPRRSRIVLVILGVVLIVPLVLTIGISHPCGMLLHTDPVWGMP